MAVGVDEDSPDLFRGPGRRLLMRRQRLRRRRWGGYRCRLYRRDGELGPLRNRRCGGRRFARLRGGDGGVDGSAAAPFSTGRGILRDARVRWWTPRRDRPYFDLRVARGRTSSWGLVKGPCQRTEPSASGEECRGRNDEWPTPPTDSGRVDRGQRPDGLLLDRAGTCRGRRCFPSPGPPIAAARRAAGRSPGAVDDGLCGLGATSGDFSSSRITRALRLFRDLRPELRGGRGLGREGGEHGKDRLALERELAASRAGRGRNRG